MSKRIYWFVGSFVLIFVFTFIAYAVKLLMIRWYMHHFQEPPIAVSTVKVSTDSWHPLLSAVGSLKASNGVDVTSEVNGQILAIYFHSGDSVKKGDLLIQLDDQVDKQTLQSDEAKLRLDQIDYERKQKLLLQNAVAKSAVDSAKAAYLQSLAAVASDKVILSKKQIRAPFAGKIGIRQINIGQYITPGTTIVTLQALNPLFVDFSMPEQFIPVLKTGQTVLVHVDAYPKKTFIGKIVALNAKIDIDTRSLEVRAVVPNADMLLFPGLFADVKIVLPQKKNVVVIPQTAVTYSLYGDFVYVVEEKGKDKNGQSIFIAMQKYIKTGEDRNSIVSVTYGLSPGETIVTAGQIKLHADSRVMINNKIPLHELEKSHEISIY